MNKYDFLFKNFNFDDNILQRISLMVEKRISIEKEWSRNPFRFNKEYDFWEIEKEEYPNFPNGGFDSEQQLNIALAIWKANTDTTYTKLYDMSKFILKGLTV
jgi:hypothetical protein